MRRSATRSELFENLNDLSRKSLCILVLRKYNNLLYRIKQEIIGKIVDSLHCQIRTS